MWLWRDIHKLGTCTALPEDQVHFPALMLSGLQTAAIPATPAPEDPTPSSGLQKHLRTCNIHMLSHTKNKKNKSKKTAYQQSHWYPLNQTDNTGHIPN